MRRELSKSTILIALCGLAFVSSCASFASATDSGSVNSASADPVPGSIWLGTWTASPQPHQQPPTVANQTLRQIVHLSQGGSRLRVRLSNLYGHDPLTIDAASLALQIAGPEIQPVSLRPLTFSGQSHVAIPPGADLESDPVSLTVPALSNLAISLYIAKSTSLTTFHSVSSQTSFISSVGDFTKKTTLTPSQMVHSWYIVTGVEIEAGADAHGLVTIGDSITDGVCSTPDHNARWPDALAGRLFSTPPAHPVGVMNQGIGYNRVLNFQPNVNQPSESALARFDRDVLAEPGLTHVVLLEGINDINLEPDTVISTDIADRLIAAYKTLAQKARAKGLHIFGATLTPFAGTGSYLPARRDARHLVNDWIRTSGTFDGVLDFDQVMQDPTDPEKLKAAFDCGDHLHPNDAGYAAMAASIDLRNF